MQMTEFSASEFTPPRKLDETEAVRLEDLERAIKRLVRVTAPGNADEVDLPKIGVSLTAAEGRAFLLAYEGENSFRADFAAAVRALFVIHHRLASELQKYLGRRETIYLWQDHVCTLNYLIDRARTALGSSRTIVDRAAQRGLMEHIMTLQTCGERLELAVQQACDTIHERTLLATRMPQFVYQEETCLLD